MKILSLRIVDTQESLGGFLTAVVQNEDCRLACPVLNCKTLSYRDVLAEQIKLPSAFRSLEMTFLIRKFLLPIKQSLTLSQKMNQRPSWTRIFYFLKELNHRIIPLNNIEHHSRQSRMSR